MSTLKLPLAVLTFPLLAAGCFPTENRVERFIDEANYCETADECVNLGSYCDFGCYVLVNEAEAEDVQRRIDNYYDTHPDNCALDCIAADGFDCVGRTCVWIEDTG